MANLSDKTRKEQVFDYLSARENIWVDGPELANKEVGGSEGLRRLREARAELTEAGFRVEKRMHPDPDRDIWQYRLVRTAEGPNPESGAIDKKFTSWPTGLAFGNALLCPGCKGRSKRVDPISKKQGPCSRCNGFGVIPA
jgi:hypothetical protein